MAGSTTPARQLAALFLRLGATAFGGPAAHIAMMRHEVVARLGWLDDQEFLDHVGACNVIPGPNSTELAIAIGARRGGWKGLLVAGTSFIVPAFLIVLVLAALYREYQDTPTVVDLRYGVLPVIMAVVGAALVGLGRTAVKGFLTGVVAAGATAAYLLDVPELAILAVGGLLGAAATAARRVGGMSGWIVPLALLAPPRALLAQVAAADVTLGRLFVVFLKAGATLYGTGYVLIAYIEHDLVDRLGWLTEQQLLDAIAVGQFTPGPLFTTATFVGFVLAGLPGAVVATVGIFAPAFVFVALLHPIVQWSRRTPWTRDALDGVNAAAVGLMAGVTVELARTAFPDAVTVAVGVVALAVLLRWKVNSAWLVLAGAAIGLVHGVAG